MSAPPPESFLPLYQNATESDRVGFRLDLQGRLLAKCPACLAERTEPADGGAVEVVRAVQAFAALLAVARESFDHRDAACSRPHHALDEALSALDAAHPGWRKWA